MQFNSNGIVSGIVEIVFEVACFQTAKTVLPLVSFGRLISEDKPGPWWNPFHVLPDGRIAVSHSGTSVVGVLIWIVVALAIVLLLR